MNVLVADDHELVRSSLVSLLQSASIASQISEASNAQQTIEQIDQSDFDLISLDLFMPDAQGFDLVRRVCNQQIDAKISLFQPLKRLPISARHSIWVLQPIFLSPLAHQ